MLIDFIKDIVSRRQRAIDDNMREQLEQLWESPQHPKHLQLTPIFPKTDAFLMKRGAVVLRKFVRDEVEKAIAEKAGATHEMQ